jgi:formate/nitrite transporter FocA (FNT family)
MAAATEGKSDHLNESERAEASARRAPRALLIHEIIRDEGEMEVGRRPAALFWSGLAAGLSMGFSFLVMALIQADLPDAPWRHLIAGFGYSLGFVIVVLGRQQLYTESTLTAILPALTRRTPAAFGGTLKVWSIVLLANLLGTWIFAALLAHQGLFKPAVWAALNDLSSALYAHPAFGPLVVKAVLSGWLIALMVWLLPSAGAARPLIILMLTYAVAIGQLPHIVAGSVEAAFAVWTGQADIGAYVRDFLAPVLLGNTLGGVSLVGLLNHAPLSPELAGQRGDG